MLNPKLFDPKQQGHVRVDRAGKRLRDPGRRESRGAWASATPAAWLFALLAVGPAGAQTQIPVGQIKPAPSQTSKPLQAPRGGRVPPRVLEAQRFLRERGWTPGHRMMPRAGAIRTIGASATVAATGAQVTGNTQSLNTPSVNATPVNTWQPLGPSAVQTPDFGLVTGRVAAIAFDPSDPTGNRLYLGTTGGGVWVANNAAVSTPASVVFSPLTDSVAALGGAPDASISIGALTVQPGETGVILAGTGDPNDVLDSYYGAGILRSTDGGNTWSLIQQTVDREEGLSLTDATFAGQGFAGFAWSTANPQLVVAAVSQAFEGALVNADWPLLTFEGLFYSTDSGATWHLATITDGSGEIVQGPTSRIGSQGNAATAVVWNPVRQLFVVAVRFHGYYQSPDGVTWTRMAAQPGTGLTTQICPTNFGQTGSIACPIYRGALAVNPQTGDTFAWTVDLNNQDQGLWQDQCAMSGAMCGNPTVTFGTQLNTAALETSNLEGAATILDGDYNLTLAAVPSQQDTLVMAGANDLWKCGLAVGCAWRNATNSTTCSSAQVAEYQHALAWNSANPLEIFLGNDSGLWRSVDAIGETGAACAATDSTHFQNLNGSLGSLAEVVSVPPVVTSPYELLAGLGDNGTAGVKNSSPVTDWPQILSGYGGPVAIDLNSETNWYVNNEAGVAIYGCSQAAPCTRAAFGSSPAVTDADVGGDGDTMPTPAPFLVDPLDDSQLLIGTCRVWRGPASGSWSASNAISPILDSGATGAACNGDGLIRSMAAVALSASSEIIYVGTYGAASNGANLPGHVLRATVSTSSGAAPVWQDLTLNSVVNDTRALNSNNFDISSVVVDAHDPSGNTVYATVAGMENPAQGMNVVYRSANGGATWNGISANLPNAPANSLTVDPQDSNTVYVATDQGVYFTTEVQNCAQSTSSCWSVFGSGLPDAPVVALSATPSASSTPVLVAATYGRGIWQTALWSTATGLTAAAANPSSLAFSTQVFDTSSSPLTVTLNNTGNLALTATSISMSGDFGETDNCVNAPVAVGASCVIQVTFTPQATGPLSGTMTIYGNVYGGQLTVDLTGAGSPAGAASLAPSSVAFGQVEVGTTSLPLQVSATNSSALAIPISSVSITPPFSLSSNSCGTTSLPANSVCQLDVVFAPTAKGLVTGLLTFIDGAGTQTVELSGTGVAPPADVLSPTSLTFPSTPEGQLSASESVTLTNSGGVELTAISISTSAQFQQTSTCGTQLAAGADCTISVVFAPNQAGTIAGTLTVVDALRSQTVTLSGIGAGPPAFSVNPSGLTFTNQQPGVPSAPQTLTISNVGGSPMANVGFSITGAAASSYSIAGTTCGALLNNGSSCTVQIVFTPSATGAIAAALAVSSSTLGVAPVSVPLNGSGQLSGGLTVNPSLIAFPVVAIGQSSAAQPVTVTNSSSYSISSVSLAIAAPFSLTQNTCPGSLAAGANCTVSVVFQPSVGGAASGTLTVTSSAVAAPVTVALSGTGFDFSVGITGSGTQSVASGQTASYNLEICGTGGCALSPTLPAGGTFSFQCGTLPTNALCTFNPTTETLNGGVQGNVLVEISSGNAAAARLESPDFATSNVARLRAEKQNSAKTAGGRNNLWRALPLACGLFLIPLAYRRQRKMFLLAVLAAFFTCGVSSCVSSGGGTGGTGSKGGGSDTSPGTYTIPISITSTGITRSVNVTLTVD
jgi:centrosomal CEP192-like protein/ASPM-SPD-2-Hydin domain-containing protein